jgi:hypothetical protein
MSDGCMMFPEYKYQTALDKRSSMYYNKVEQNKGADMKDKTNEDVYEEIRDREEYIAAKLLGKKQHACYLDMKLYEKILKMSKEDGRSFNSMLIQLVLKGLAVVEQDV